MGQILQNWRIPAAALFSTTLVVGAYVGARSIESALPAHASMETALLEAIAAKDSDGDGLPDWEEALYGTSSSITDSFKLGMTDAEAVARGLIVPKAIADIAVATSAPSSGEVFDPSLSSAPAKGTLTAAFAENFFSLYLAVKQSNGGANLSEADLRDIADRALGSLAATVEAAPDFKAAKDLAVSGSGADALKAFAARAEAVLLKNTSTASKSELAYLSDAVERDDREALAQISSIAKAYRDSAFGLAMLSSPTELAAVHLALVNALMRVSGIASDFVRVNVDPLATMLALRQYPQTVLALGTAFVNIGEIYAAAGVSLPPGEPGASFVNLIVDVANEQATAKKP